MNMESLVIFLVIGAIAGWLGGRLMPGGGFGLPGNIFVGIIGGVIGGFLFRLLAIFAGGLIGSMVTAAAGAIVLVYVIEFAKKRKNRPGTEE